MRVSVGRSRRVAEAEKNRVRRVDPQCFVGLGDRGLKPAYSENGRNISTRIWMGLEPHTHHLSLKGASNDGTSDL